MQAVRHFLLAIQFFTRIPVTGRLAQWVGFSPEMLRASAGHLPGVGWVVGLCTASVMAVLLWALPPVAASAWVAAVLSTAAGAWLTGAFHEDGLTDLVDGLGGSLDRERSLDIMKDSRIGSFGALALLLAIAAKCGLLALLATVSPALAVLALWGAHVASRLPPLLIIRLLPHVGDTPRSKSKPLADAISPAALATGLAWWALAMAGLHWAWPSAGWWGAVLATGVVTVFMVRWLRRRLQGFTGDALGATQQLAEIGFYLGLAIALPASLPVPATWAGLLWLATP